MCVSPSPQQGPSSPARPPGAAGFGPAGPAAFRSSSLGNAAGGGSAASASAAPQEVLVVDLPPGETPPSSRSPSPPGGEHLAVHTLQQRVLTLLRLHLSASEPIRACSHRASTAAGP
jgi:hypothetical protein